MKRREWIFFWLCAIAYVLARGPVALVGPFILPFENAFQESIALHHLGHLWDNRFLPVLARIDGQNFWHTAHPPLLHLFYAGLYSIFGTAEWVTRAAALGLYLASIVLWRRTGADADQPGWPLYPLALFLPVPFLLATTTNYEPLSIFFVSLIFYLSEREGMCERLQSRKDAGLEACGTKPGGPPIGESARPWVGGEATGFRNSWPIIIALIPGLLVDWPVYLAVPALLLRHWRERPRRNLFLKLIAFEFVFLAALLGYMHWVAGEVALFGHAPQRANPVGLFSPALWRELGSHWMELSGVAVTIVAAVAVMAGIVRSVCGKNLDGPQRPASAFELFALFTVLLVLAAPQLVSRHHVYLLYFAPPVALALKELVLRVEQKKLAVLALVILFAAPNYIARYQRNPAYWAMAERVKDKGIKTAFASAAIGAWYYYAGIETVFPMSVQAARWIHRDKPPLLHLDIKNLEVLTFSGFIDQRYLHFKLYDLPGEEVSVERRRYPRQFTYLTFSIGDQPSKNSDWNFILDDQKPKYGFYQHPLGSTQRVRFLRDHSLSDRKGLSFEPRIIHSLPRVKSDGVQFSVLESPHPSSRRSGELSLNYSRFVPDNISARRVSILTRDEQQIWMTTLPGPKNDSSFDDAWWLEPIWVPVDGGSAE